MLVGAQRGISNPTQQLSKAFLRVHAESHNQGIHEKADKIFQP